MIAPATQPAPMMTAIPPPTPSASAVPLRGFLVDRAEGGMGVDDDAEHRETGRRERSLVRVADGDRVEREQQRTDEGHGQEDDAGRDAATGGGHADAPNVL